MKKIAKLHLRGNTLRVLTDLGDVVGGAKTDACPSNIATCAATGCLTGQKTVC